MSSVAAPAIHGNVGISLSLLLLMLFSATPSSAQCVQCSNTRPNNMIVNDQYCNANRRIFTSRCGTEGSWWVDAPEPYCQYSCWENGAGYDDYPCCPIEDVAAYVPPAVEKEAGCVECTNYRTESMIENNQMCDSAWNVTLNTQCNNPGSEWNTWDDPPCQYECWRWGKPYDRFQNCCQKDYEPHFGLKPCVQCTNTRTQAMISNDRYCDRNTTLQRRCDKPWSWWRDAPEPYCQYSCWEEGVGYDDYPCCEIDDLDSYVPPPAEKEPGCTECSNFRTQYMTDNGRNCDWAYVLDAQCNNEGSFWNTLNNPPCQYECWLWGKPYDKYQNCCKQDAEPHFGLSYKDLASSSIKPPTPRPTRPPTTPPAPTLPRPCVACSNVRPMNMIVNDLYCDTATGTLNRRCGKAGSWWIDAPEPYCQYSCWADATAISYDDYPCCPIEDLTSYVPPPVEKAPGCVECSNDRDEFMTESRRMCDSWSYVLDTQCNNEGSFWNTLDNPPCQYECWLWGKPYDRFQNCCQRDYEPHFGLESRAG